MGKEKRPPHLKMTSLQRYHFLPILLSYVTPAFAEVVKSMSDCDHFLLGQTPPQVPGILEGGEIQNQNRYKPICQTYRNERRFLTLYDVKNKIPVFSAYRYRGQKDRGRPKKFWKVEPQLEDEHANKNMMGWDKDMIYNHQAVSTDYRSNGTFDRGHILPSSYGFTSMDKRSTFTLTNIVPQAATFNKGSWSRMETCIKCVMDTYCISSNGITEGFVVTGAQASHNTLNNRVNVPSLLWSAFCCYSSKLKMWIASAHLGNNVPDESKKKYLQTNTLAELHSELRTAGAEFQVFPGTQCPLHTTVTKLYPEIQNCNCPSSNSATTATPTSSSAISSSTPTSSSAISSSTPTSSSAISSSTPTSSSATFTSPSPSISCRFP